MDEMREENKFSMTKREREKGGGGGEGRLLMEIFDAFA